jgi:hypothetical protein
MAPNSNVLPTSQHLQRKRKYNSDEGDFSDDDSGFSPKSSSPSADDDRRAHHNELERRRRDHIKDHFSSLKNAIPLLEGEKSSRALILKRAVDYIQVLQAQLKEAKMEIDDYKRHRNTNTTNNNETQFRIQNNSASVFNGMLQAPQQQQLQQVQQPQSIIQQLPSVSTAFLSHLPPTASVIQHQQQQSLVFPNTVSECLQSSSTSPLLTVSPPSYIPTLPLQPPPQQPQQQQHLASDSTKNALLSQLLQLIQSPNSSTLLPPPPLPTTVTTLPQISLPRTDFNNNNQQLFAFHERQLASAVHL